MVSGVTSYLIGLIAMVTAHYNPMGILSFVGNGVHLPSGTRNSSLKSLAADISLGNCYPW